LTQILLGHRVQHPHQQLANFSWIRVHQVVVLDVAFVPTLLLRTEKEKEKSMRRSIEEQKKEKEKKKKSGSNNAL
jgi:hypothetical protein